MADSTWQIWADTGGTFTDCLAIDPSGDLHRAKVLSSSSIRGHVKAQVDTQRLSIDLPWELPDGFFRGALLRLLKTDGGSGFVRMGFASTVVGVRERIWLVVAAAPSAAASGP